MSRFLVLLGCIGLAVGGSAIWILIRTRFLVAEETRTEVFSLDTLLTGAGAVAVLIASVYALIVGVRMEQRQVRPRARSGTARPMGRWQTSGGNLALEGIVWSLASGAAVAGAVAWLYSLSGNSYGSYGMGPTARILELVVSSVPIGLLLIAGAIGFFVGLARTVLGLGVFLSGVGERRAQAVSMRGSDRPAQRENRQEPSLRRPPRND